MILNILIALCVTSALVSMVSFILYTRARMAEEDEKERLYRSVHFTSLFIFVLLGVLILVIFSNRPAKDSSY